MHIQVVWIDAINRKRGVHNESALRILQLLYRTAAARVACWASEWMGRGREMRWEENCTRSENKQGKSFSISQKNAFSCSLQLNIDVIWFCVLLFVRICLFTNFRKTEKNPHFLIHIWIYTYSQIEAQMSVKKTNKFHSHQSECWKKLSWQQQQQHFGNQATRQNCEKVIQPLNDVFMRVE